MRRRLVLLLVATMVALTACENARPDPPTPMPPPPPSPSATPSAAEVRWFPARPDTPGWLAVVSGTLVLTTGGCVALTVRGPDDGSHVLVLPPGVTADRDGLRGPGFGLIRFGRVVRGGGGYADWPAGAPHFPAVPRDCWAADEEPDGLAVLSLPIRERYM